MFDIRLRHRVQHAERAGDVVVVIRQRLGNRFTDRFECGEMNHGFDALGAHHLRQGGGV